LTVKIKFDKKELKEKLSPGTESKSSKGNPVRNGNGPAAVIGDETGQNHCPVLTGWEGIGSRRIRKSEDLPGYSSFL